MLLEGGRGKRDREREPRAIYLASSKAYAPLYTLYSHTHTKVQKTRVTLLP